MRLTLALLLTCATALPVAAQTGRPPASPGSDAPAVSFRPFFLISAQQPAAKNTFEAAFGDTVQPFWVGGVQAEGKVELKGDRRGAGRADRRHPVQIGHLAELALQRRGDGGGHDLGAGARIRGLDLDGGVVDLG